MYLLETGFNLDVSGVSYFAKVWPQEIYRGSVEKTWTGIYNVLSTVGTAERRGNSWEAAIYPQATGMKGAEFIAELEKIFERLSKEFNLHQLSLWQNKFPFREDNEFCDSHHDDSGSKITV